jgi:hypothetical protein
MVAGKLDVLGDRLSQRMTANALDKDNGEFRRAASGTRSQVEDKLRARATGYAGRQVLPAVGGAHHEIGMPQNVPNTFRPARSMPVLLNGESGVPAFEPCRKSRRTAFIDFMMVTR